ncbi:MAG TPA: adenylate/guanylate cyclase domain-containing protein [Solirubrobacteraceae bacterium]|jgi:adenylate cyclase|nr:adenylate/guanylate cyclase domain-containing protein [Solirubrobacteraceae bacterium]
MRRRQRRTRALLAVAVLAAGVGLVGYATHLLRRSELQTIDARFSIRGTQHAPSNLVLVQIDNATLQEFVRLHMRSEFPFPRRYDAQVIDRLRQAGASTIALDLEFTHQTDERDDNALIEAIGRAHGKTVLGASEVEPGGRTDVLGGPGLLRQLQARAAEVRLTLDTDGVTRRFAYAYNGLHSFPVVTVETATVHPVHASRFERGTLPIDFVGPPGTVSSISYSKVLLGQFSPSVFAGKIAVVGVSAPILGDVHTTATTGGSQMPGPEIWANAANTLLHGVPLKDAPGWVNVLIIALLGVAVPLGSLRLRGWRSLLDALALAVVFTVATQIAFNSGVIISFVYPLLALALGTLGTLAVLYMGEAIERERVRDVFSRFVPAGVVDEVLASTGENLRLGGVERDCTVLFSDLRGFTTFSETQPAARVIEVVNYYLNEMSEAILAAGGTLVAYMGDGIMAIFGAPLEQDDHADRAMIAAREMIGPRLDRFNAWLEEQGFGHTFAMGVGLNSGPVMAGNVGSEQRVEYTAIGDTTNTASRLEGMTKNSEAMLFVADSTRERMRTSTGDLSPVGEVEIRGRAGKLKVWKLWPTDGARDGEDEQSEPRTVRQPAG